MCIPCDCQLPPGSDKKKQTVGQMPLFSQSSHHVARHGSAGCRRSMLSKAREALERGLKDLLRYPAQQTAPRCTSLRLLCPPRWGLWQQRGLVHRQAQESAPRVSMPRLQLSRRPCNNTDSQLLFLRAPQKPAARLR